MVDISTLAIIDILDHIFVISGCPVHLHAVQQHLIILIMKLQHFNKKDRCRK